MDFRDLGVRASLIRFIALYAALYGAFGVASPFLPAFLAERGLDPASIGMVLAAGTSVRLVAGPVAGRMADRWQAARAILTCCTLAAALVAFGYLPAQGFLLLLAVSMAHAAVLAPMAPLSDALALRAAIPSGGASQPGAGFNYGWVRGAGSAAFIIGSVLSGQAVGLLGLDAIIWLNGGLLAACVLCAARVPAPVSRLGTPPPVPGLPKREGVRTLLHLRPFRRVVLVAALILGSHAMHDGFVVIHWRDAGIGTGVISVLWSEAVAAEVVVFLLLGRFLLSALGPAGALALAALAGVLRWGVLAMTPSVLAGALVEPLHGLTFALQHLATMRLITEMVPARIAATAQTLYATLGVGAASAAVTLLSGPLYGRFGAGGFWVMSALCALALPVIWRVHRDGSSLPPHQKESSA